MRGPGSQQHQRWQRISISKFGQMNSEATVSFRADYF